MHSPYDLKNRLLKLIAIRFLIPCPICSFGVVQFLEKNWMLMLDVIVSPTFVYSYNTLQRKWLVPASPKPLSIVNRSYRKARKRGSVMLTLCPLSTVFASIDDMQWTAVSADTEQLSVMCMWMEMWGGGGIQAQGLMIHVQFRPVLRALARHSSFVLQRLFSKDGCVMTPLLWFSLIIICKHCAHQNKSYWKLIKTHWLLCCFKTIAVWQ